MLADQDQERAAGFDGPFDGVTEILACLDLVEVHEHVRSPESIAEPLVKLPGVPRAVVPSVADEDARSRWYWSARDGCLRRRKALEKTRQLGVFRTVGQHEDAFFGLVLLLKFRDLLVQGQAVVAGFIAGVDLAQPRAEGLEVRVGKTFATADEEQALSRGQGANDRLGMGIFPHVFVRPDAQHHGLRLVPMAVQMEDRLFFAVQDAQDFGLIPPRHGRELGHSFEKIIVVGGGQRNLQIAQSFEHGGVAELERADGFAEPAAELAPGGRLELAGDFFRRGQGVVEVAGGDLTEETFFPGLVESGVQRAALGGAQLEQSGPGSGGGVLRRRDRDAGADHHQDSAPGDLPEGPVPRCQA